MSWVLCVFILCLGVLVRADDTCSQPSSDSTTTAKLKNNILYCGYDRSFRPVKYHKYTTNVTFHFLLHYFSYDHFNHMLSVDSRLYIYWTDQHLTWQPKNYDGIKTIALSSDEIWIPDLSIYNLKGQPSDPKIVGNTLCLVNYLGFVFCAPPLHFDALCVPNLKHFPYDTQQCTVSMGSWAFTGEQINITMAEPFVSVDEMQPNGEWELTSNLAIKHIGNYSTWPNNTFPSIDLVLNIKRNGHTHAINVVLPLIVCILLTITTMVMSPLNKDRFVLSCVTLIAHIFQIENVSYNLPVIGENLPFLLKLSRDSTLLAGFSIVITVVLKNWMQNKSTCPSWVSTTANGLIQSKPGQWILLNDQSFKSVAAVQKQEDSEVILSKSEQQPQFDVISDWYIFAKLLDVLFLIGYLLAYFIILVQL